MKLGVDVAALVEDCALKGDDAVEAPAHGRPVAGVASIPTWAWGSVNVAVYMGIITGYADGSFGPNIPVTYAEAVAMLIRGVPGHAAQVGAGIWPCNFLFYGVDSGFTGGVDVGFANLPCTRGDMAQMMVATMQIK